MTRVERILGNIKKSDLGLEIGPSHNPCAPKSQGYNCEVVDHLSKEELINKYRKHNVNINSIEDVDYIWKGRGGGTFNLLKRRIIMIIL